MRLLVDCDPALLVPGLDVDDDLALLVLLGSPEVEIAGVTTTYGNTLGPLAYLDARRLLALSGRRDIPVSRGAGWTARHFRETEASRFLVESVRRAPGELTLVTLGPLTNVAAAAAAWPGFAGSLADLVILGGRSREGRADFNFRAHPEAAQRVLSFTCRKALLPIDLCFPAVVTQAGVARLAGARGSVVARYASTLRRFARWQDAFRTLQGRAPGQGSRGFHPWDVLVPAWLLTRKLFAGVREHFPAVSRTGRTLFLPGGVPPATVPSRVHAEGLIALLLARATGPRLGGA